MKKRYECNRCGAPANLDFEGQGAGFVAAITHHKSDLESAEWLDTAGVWMWIQGGIAIKSRGAWQRYLRPRYSVIDLGALFN